MLSPLPHVIRRTILPALLAIALVLPTAVADPEPLPEYRLTILGTLGGESSEALSINERGQVVGKAETADGETHAFLWERGRMRDLGTLPGGSYGEARDINHRGEIVGLASSLRGRRRAVLWKAGVAWDLGTLGGDESWANAISDEGEIVGAAELARSKPRGLRGPAKWAFRLPRRDWFRGGQVESGRLQPVPEPKLSRWSSASTLVYGSEAFDVDRGFVVGAMWVDAEVGLAVWPFTWVGRRLRVQEKGDRETFPRAVRYPGLVVGAWAGVAGDDPWAWAAPTRRKLTRQVTWLELPPRVLSEARGVNRFGTVVGNAWDCAEGDCPPVGWVYREGQPISLSELLPPGSGWTICAANAINDRGQIVGQAERDGRRVACLLTPVGSGSTP